MQILRGFFNSLFSFRFIIIVLTIVAFVLGLLTLILAFKGSITKLPESRKIVLTSIMDLTIYLILAVTIFTGLVIVWKGRKRR